MRNPIYPEFCSLMVLLDGSDDRSYCRSQFLYEPSRRWFKVRVWLRTANARSRWYELIVRSALFWLVIEIGAAPHLWVFSIKRKFYSKLRISFSDEMWKLSYWMCYSEYLMLYSLWDCCFIDSLPPLCDDFLLGYHRLRLFCRGTSHQNSLCDDFLLGYCLLKLFCWVRW